MKMRSLLVLFIVFSIAIQNTCPFNFAGKTSFASSFVHHCPCANKAAGQKADGNASRPVLLAAGPSFVFIGQEKTFTDFLYVSMSVRPVCSEDFYESISLNPPENPPRFS
jgi:hypothetical protein